MSTGSTVSVVYNCLLNWLVESQRKAVYKEWSHSYSMKQKYVGFYESLFFSSKQVRKGTTNDTKLPGDLKPWVRRKNGHPVLSDCLTAAQESSGSATGLHPT